MPAGQHSVPDGSMICTQHPTCRQSRNGGCTFGDHPSHILWARQPRQRTAP